MVFHTTSVHIVTHQIIAFTYTPVAPLVSVHLISVTDLSTDLLVCLDFTIFIGQYCSYMFPCVFNAGLAVVIYPITVHVSCRSYLSVEIIVYIVCLLLFSYSDTRWDGSDIVVLNDVKICSPYTNCQESNKDLQKRLQAKVRNFDNIFLKLLA